jgi:DNA (cytosine-5)-methyltransferase 1
MRRWTMTIGSLFSGIGGLELGLERAGLGPVLWQVEIDSYCRAVLAKHWSDATRFSDVREVDGAALPTVDVLAGGFPCQDLSSANLAARGLDGERSGLWFEYLRIVEAMRPRAVVVENVAGLRSRGHLATVAGGLHELGYEVEIAEFEAGDVGAPFRGVRVFVVATTHGDGEPARTVDAEVARVSDDAGHLGHWRSPFRGAARVADGIPGRMDRVRSSRLGNAVVPQMAYVVGCRVRARLEAA